MSQRVSDIPRLPDRSRDAHKGDFGKVLVVAGSRGMSGAAALVANSALRSGAGLVRVATAWCVQLTVAQMAPCATTIGLAEDVDGMIGPEATGSILEVIGDNDVVALGPGLGRSVGLESLVQGIVERVELPMVIDADGLNNLAALGVGVLPLSSKTVLTPHPGEMGRLWSAWCREPLPKDRVEQAEKLAQRSGAVVMLKGAGTVVADGLRTYTNETGNPGMATGGSGDVLTGCVAALVGQGMDVFEAAVLGCFVHGRAGDIAAERLSQTALMASDIIDAMPAAWMSLA